MSCHFVSCHVNAWAWHAHRGERFLIRVLIWRDQHGMVWYVCCTLYVCMYACMCDQSMHACMYVVHTYIALHCNTLLCIALYCIALYCIALYYITFTLHYIYITLHCIALHSHWIHLHLHLHYITLNCIALRCITLHIYIYIYTCTYGYIMVYDYCGKARTNPSNWRFIIGLTTTNCKNAVAMRIGSLFKIRWLIITFPFF